MFKCPGEMCIMILWPCQFACVVDIIICVVLFLWCGGGTIGLAISGLVVQSLAVLLRASTLGKSFTHIGSGLGR